MEALACRSPRACATCPWSDRAGACTLEAQVDLALDALSPPRRAFPTLAAAPARAWT